MMLSRRKIRNFHLRKEQYKAKQKRKSNKKSNRKIIILLNDRTRRDSMTRHEEILKFWFDQIVATDHYFEERNELWFGGTPETDAMIRSRFEKDVKLAETGQLSAWGSDPRSCLALIILLDQFSLNIYRDLPQSF